MIKIDYQLMYTGYCLHPEWVTIKGGKWGNIQFPAMCALLQHPEHGNIVFDTGYATSFFEGTRKLPMSLYRKITPVTLKEQQTLVAQLAAKNIAASSIKKVILSHFHADHMCALDDFCNAQYICSKEGYDSIHNLKGIAALRKGFLPNLLPDDFCKRAYYIEESKQVDITNILSPFSVAHDILGDGSILAIFLPGHARAQFGIFFYDSNESPTFFVSDSCWSSKAYRENLLPAIFAYFIMDNRRDYNDTLKKLHQLHQQSPKIKLIPSHCMEIKLAMAENLDE